MTSLMYPLPVRSLKEILVHVIPNATLGAVEELRSTHLPRLYKLNMSDNRKLLLSFAPSLAIRLLRQEGQLLSSEATLVNFIAGSESKDMDNSSVCKTEQGMLLGKLVPKLLKHSSNNREMAYPYSIFEEPAGQPLSTLAIYLSIPERREVDKQVGTMTRALATLTSPNGAFGTVSRVLAEPITAATAGPQSSIPPPRIGFKSWSKAFNTLLEGILRDGEDVSVLLPYDTIRAHYERLSWHLDAVTLPRLTILDIGSKTNIMISRGLPDLPLSSSTDIKLTGLRSWSQGVFGDPLIADAFENPSEGFLEGWKGDRIVIEEEEDVKARVLLYRCYRAVVGIVTEHYRPQVDSSRKELEGRRKLTIVLAELEKVDIVVNDALKRARSPSDAGEASKRPKLEMNAA
jgi:hypothetical protein